MSVLGKTWVLQNENGGVPLLERLLTNRKLDTEEKRRAFLESGLEALHDPFLLKDMDKAVERLGEAIDRKEKIRVFGDYDVDGITATAIVLDFLRRSGADADSTLPHRENDGYGLKNHFIRRFAEEGVKVLVTVDNGTANHAEIELANALGITVIVTDHHSMPDVLPSAHALVNPKRPDCAYPNKGLSGSAIAYKLVHALASRRWQAEEGRPYLFRQLGLAALGLVADCMPLTGENRVLVKAGLESIRQGNHPGLMELIQKAGLTLQQVDSVAIGFQIGPRLNAAGRMDKPDHALELLLGDTAKADMLERLNRQRQKSIETYLKEAVAQLESGGAPASIIAAYNPNWSAGLIGLMAGKLAEKYRRPAIIMREREEDLVGSFRSFGALDLTECLRREAGELFSTFGGHAAAGGFTLPRTQLATFLERVAAVGPRVVTPESTRDVLSIECEVAAKELTLETLDQLVRLEPFGQANPQPTLMLKGARLAEIRRVGKTGDHLQFPVQSGSGTVGAIAFRFGEHAAKLRSGKEYDLAFCLEANEWKGARRVQLRILDLRESLIPKP